MVQDRVRTETYRAAIMQNQSYIEGKVISLLLIFLFILVSEKIFLVKKLISDNLFSSLFL